MNAQTFDKILNERLEKIRYVLGVKGKEYALNGDMLHNVNEAGRINGMTSAQGLWGIATKHLVSVMDLVFGRLPATEEMVNEKIGDLINYLILLEAVLKDKNAKDI
jgi:hypothetical protein